GRSSLGPPLPACTPAGQSRDPAPRAMSSSAGSGSGHQPSQSRDRKFLLQFSLAQTPPSHLPNIPGVTNPGTLIEDSKVEVNNLNNLNDHDRKHAVGDDAQFKMDI
uniref:Uncharacterized protein n=1 Tax=Sciurus vulgaris TaxID=55149 RepID=A0A8D2DBX2_SCIVU